jgi:hypothetical protein
MKRGHFSSRFLAGLAFGLGFGIALILLAGTVVLGVGGFLAKKTADAVSAIAFESLTSKSKPAGDVEGLVLLSTNITKVGSTLLVSGVLTNTTPRPVYELLIWATLAGDFQTEASTWTTKYFETFPAGESRELTFIYEDLGSQIDPTKLSVALEFSTSSEATDGAH